MTVLVTMPGRFGDILWALPTVRALAERYGPVSFVTSPKYSSILELLRAQPYIADAWIEPAWDVQETAPMTPWEAPVSREELEELHVDHVYHLGYRQWPELPLALEIARNAGGWAHDLKLDEPWITVPVDEHADTRIVVGFSSEYIELKMGVLMGLLGHFADTRDDLRLAFPAQAGHRAWEWDKVFSMSESDWPDTAWHIASSDVFLGCLSAPWVLANALGKPTVIVEPNPNRHHPIFWRESVKNVLVRGSDGLPTFDLRHVCDELERVLATHEVE